MKLLLKSAFLFFLLIFVFLSVKTVKAQTCVCQSDNNCHSSCAVYQPENRLTGVTYTSPYKCTLNLTNQWSTDPTAANKNSFCTRSLRTKGDADGTGGVDELIDFGYWFRGAILAKLPPGINPDFDGDGVIGNTDLAIWQAGRGAGVTPTPTTILTPTATPTTTITPTATLTPTASVTPTPVLVAPACTNQQVDNPEGRGGGGDGSLITTTFSFDGRNTLSLARIWPNCYYREVGTATWTSMRAVSIVITPPASGNVFPGQSQGTLVCDAVVTRTKTYEVRASVAAWYDYNTAGNRANLHDANEPRKDTTCNPILTIFANSM